MTKAHVIALSTIILLCFGAASAGAVCSDGDQNINDTGSATFGLRWDGVMIGAGQSFTLDCAAKFLTASFELRTVAGGTDNLLSTDEMILELMDPSFTVLATMMMPLGFDDGVQWVQFDISSQDIILQPGEYIVGCRTEAPRGGSVMFDPDNNHAGSRHIYWIDEWTAGSSNSDYCFQATWDPDAVPAEKVSWGTMKALYR